MNKAGDSPDRLDAWWDGSAICVVAVGSHGDPLDLGEHEVEEFTAKLQGCLIEAQGDLCQAFLSGHAIPGVKYRHNEYVRVVGGSHRGESGSLVAVLLLHPEAKFLLESEHHGDIEVFQSEVEHAEV